MDKQIVFEIDMETAEVTIEAQGFQGKGCKEATQPYEDALGNVKDRTTKGEMWVETTGDTGEVQHVKEV